MSEIPQTQHAVVYTGSHEDGKLVEVVKVNVPAVGNDEILIKAVAWAANPTDWKHVVFGWAEKGNISGSDVAGVIVKVGSNVKDFKVGDHVSSFNRGGSKKAPETGLFQEYVKILPETTIKYTTPLVDLDNEKSLSVAEKIKTFEAAASINLSLNTVSLPFHHFFKLSFNKSQNVGKSVLIWGGASATGIVAVQVAKELYGLNVIATASKKNHDFVKSLGADAVFDYHDSDVVEQIKKYGGEKIIYGFDTISEESTYNNTYKALADKEPAIIDNLLSLGEKNITGSKKSNVEFTQGSLVYLVQGGDHDLNGFVVPSNDELLKDHRAFMAEASKAVNSGAIQAAPIKILHNGLNSVDEAFSLLRGNKISGQKVVFRAKDNKF